MQAAVSGQYFLEEGLAECDSTVCCCCLFWGLLWQEVIWFVCYWCRLREQREKAEQRHQDEIELLTKKSGEHKTRSDALQTEVNNKQVISFSFDVVLLYSIQKVAVTFSHFVNVVMVHPWTVQCIETCCAPHRRVMVLVFEAKFCSPEFSVHPIWRS